MARWLTLALLLALPAAAQTLTKAPALLTPSEPRFPPARLDAGVGASVVMEIDVGVDGRVTKATVVQSGGADFDLAAVEAAQGLRFSPAEVDGQPAPVRIQYTSHFVVKAAAPDATPALDGGAPDAGPQINLLGVLRTAGNREPIAGAIVQAAGLEALSDERGRFELAGVPVGDVRITVSAPGHAPFAETEAIRPSERTEVTYYLSRTSANETVVRDVRERKEVAQVRLTTAEIRMIPGTNNDAFRVVQNLPGVARSPFGGGVLVVRGSKAWDSRIYVDEIQIPQLFHFAGLTATFNSATIERIGFQPGNFGAEFGRSIGGLVQGDVKTPSKSGVHGYADVNVFDVSALVEAPVSDSWSVSASGRLGLTQWVLPFALETFAPRAQASAGFGLAPEYWDYQLRAERKVPNTKDRLFVTLFGSSDRWAFLAPNPLLDGDVEGNVSAAGTAQLYNRLVFGADVRLGDGLRFVSRNAIGFDVNRQSGTVQEVFFESRQLPIQLRERLVWDVASAKLSFNVGLDALVTPTWFDAQRPPVFSPNQLPEPYVTRRLVAEQERTVFVEPGLFADATWTPTDWLLVRGGLRVDGELAVMRKLWLNPRLAVRVTPWKPLTFKAGAAMYEQPPDYRTGQLSAVFGNPGLLPEGAWHFTAGAEAKLFELLEVDLQGYYKALFNQARQTLASGLGSDLSIPGAATRFTSSGYGRAYGLEALVRVRPTKHFLGWVAYSLSRFERDYYGGVAFAPGPLDQPHNLIVVASVTFPLGFTLGGRFRVASGPLVTPIAGALFDTNANQYIPLPGLPWSERLPTFVQLDLRLDKRFTFKTWSLTAYVDVQNVTNTQNPEARFYNFNYTRSAFVTGIPILPTAGLRGEW